MSAPKKPKLDIIMRPVLSDDLTEETAITKVFVCDILNPRNISKIVKDLNMKIPVEKLNHLKRIRQNEVLLFPIEYSPMENVFNYLKQKQFDCDLIGKNLKTIDVAEIAPKTKKQFSVVNALWPCNFHPDKYLEKLCTNMLFNKNENEDHIMYMNTALHIAEKSNGTGVVIVDPNLKSVVAVGYSLSKENPCKHAIMIAIDNVAKTQNGGAWNCDTSRLINQLKIKFPQMKIGAKKLLDNIDGPYLCTSYYVYSTREPCVMCAMALIHSRVKRVFYGKKSENGGLGTLCKIHILKDLNHHYEVFEGLLEDLC